jgi:hypothetical protein
MGIANESFIQPDGYLSVCFSNAAGRAAIHAACLVIY